MQTDTSLIIETTQPRPYAADFALEAAMAGKRVFWVRPTDNLARAAADEFRIILKDEGLKWTTGGYKDWIFLEGKYGGSIGFPSMRNPLSGWRGQMIVWDGPPPDEHLKGLWVCRIRREGHFIIAY